VELVDLIGLTSSGNFDRGAALGCVMEREALMSTGIRHGIAVPHGKCDAFESMVGAIGISRSGIDYDAFDGCPVHIAFLIISPRRNPETHLRTLKLLAEILDLPGFVDALKSASSPKEVSDALELFEDRLGSA
jgi:PTS system fructose-specific IIC component/PTS system nitrogen regulatory IIA component